MKTAQAEDREEGGSHAATLRLGGKREKGFQKDRASSPGVSTNRRRELAYLCPG